MENKKLSEDQLDEVSGGKINLDETALETVTGGVSRPKFDEQK